MVESTSNNVIRASDFMERGYERAQADMPEAPTFERQQPMEAYNPRGGFAFLEALAAAVDPERPRRLLQENQQIELRNQELQAQNNQLEQLNYQNRLGEVDRQAEWIRAIGQVKSAEKTNAQNVAMQLAPGLDGAPDEVLDSIAKEGGIPAGVYKTFVKNMSPRALEGIDIANQGGRIDNRLQSLIADAQSVTNSRLPARLDAEISNILSNTANVDAETSGQLIANRLDDMFGETERWRGIQYLEQQIQGAIKNNRLLQVRGDFEEATLGTRIKREELTTDQLQLTNEGQALVNAYQQLQNRILSPRADMAEAFTFQELLFARLQNKDLDTQTWERIQRVGLDKERVQQAWKELDISEFKMMLEAHHMAWQRGYQDKVFETIMVPESESKLMTDVEQRNLMRLEARQLAVMTPLLAEQARLENLISGVRLDFLPKQLQRELKLLDGQIDQLGQLVQNLAKDGRLKDMEYATAEHELQLARKLGPFQVATAKALTQLREIEVDVANKTAVSTAIATLENLQANTASIIEGMDRENRALTHRIEMDKSELEIAQDEWRTKKWMMFSQQKLTEAQTASIVAETGLTEARVRKLHADVRNLDMASDQMLMEQYGPGMVETLGLIAEYDTLSDRQKAKRRGEVADKVLMAVDELDSAAAALRDRGDEAGAKKLEQARNSVGQTFDNSLRTSGLDEEFNTGGSGRVLPKMDTNQLRAGVTDRIQRGSPEGALDLLLSNTGLSLDEIANYRMEGGDAPDWLVKIGEIADGTRSETQRAIEGAIPNRDERRKVLDAARERQIKNRQASISAQRMDTTQTAPDMGLTEFGRLVDFITFWDE